MGTYKTATLVERINSHFKMLRPDSAIPHTITPVTERLDTNAWIDAGSPHEWQLQESKVIKGYYYRVYFDVAYGAVMLIRGSDSLNTISYGKHSADIEGEVLALDKTYYGLNKCLWE